MPPAVIIQEGLTGIIPRCLHTEVYLVIVLIPNIKWTRTRDGHLGSRHMEGRCGIKTPIHEQSDLAGRCQDNQGVWHT